MLGNRNDLGKKNYNFFAYKNSKHLSQFNKKLDGGVRPKSMGAIFEKVLNY
jgi:hypothetical protein